MNKTIGLSDYANNLNPNVISGFDIDSLIKAKKEIVKKKEPKVIGNTGSGKPIFDEQGKHDDWDSKDHMDAAEFHQQQALYHNKQKMLVNDKKQVKFHEERHKYHDTNYGEHVKSGYQAQKKESEDQVKKEQKIKSDKVREKKQEATNHSKIAELHGKIIQFIEKNGGAKSEEVQKLINTHRDKQVLHSKKALQKAEQSDLIK